MAKTTAEITSGKEFLNTAPEPVQEENDTEAATGRRMDPELRAMSALIRLLDDLDDGAKGRVIRWAFDRYAHWSNPCPSERLSTQR